MLKQESFEVINAYKEKTCKTKLRIWKRQLMNLYEIRELLKFSCSVLSVCMKIRSFTMMLSPPFIDISQ